MKTFGTRMWSDLAIIQMVLGGLQLPASQCKSVVCQQDEKQL